MSSLHGLQSLCKFRAIEIWFWGHGIYGNESKLKNSFAYVS